jgi:hypothetical protein
MLVANGVEVGGTVPVGPSVPPTVVVTLAKLLLSFVSITVLLGSTWAVLVSSVPLAAPTRTVNEKLTL